MAPPAFDMAEGESRMLEDAKSDGSGMPIDKRVEFAEALDGVGDGATVFITGLRRRGLSQQAHSRVARARPERPHSGGQLGDAPLFAHP